MDDVTPDEDAILRAAIRASGKVVETAATRAAVAAARAEIVAWLRATAAKQLLPSDGEFRAAAAYLARDIESGAPQRWAAEREKGRGLNAAPK